MARPLPPQIHQIVVVCSGNICRSPMTAALLRAQLVAEGVRGIVVQSAGTIATRGEPASIEALTTAEQHGLDISYHRSMPLTRDIIRRADVLLVMERQHRNAIARFESAAEEKTYLLGEWAEAPITGADVPDPYGMSLTFYEMIFARLRQMVRAFVEQLKQNEPNR